MSGYRWRGTTLRHQAQRQWADAQWEHDQRCKAQRQRRSAAIVMRDPTLPHQIVISYQWGVTGTGIAVSCNCRRVTGTAGVYTPFEVRERWEPADLLAVYRAHLTPRSTP